MNHIINGLKKDYQTILTEKEAEGKKNTHLISEIEKEKKTKIDMQNGLNHEL